MTTQLLIIGGGPTGLVLANLLGKLGISAVVVERQAAIYPIPRATHLDEETLRNFQLTGLMPEMEPHTAAFGRGEAANAQGKVIFSEEMIQPNVQHLYAGSRYFDQVAFERILEKGLARYPQVQMLRGAECLAIRQTAEGVEADILLAGESEPQTLRSSWLVGCDGARSMVRTALNICMTAHEEPREWLIVDTLLKNPADAALLPAHFRFMLEKERLSLFAHGIGLNRRWEFQLHKGEAQPDDAVVLGWVSKYIALEKIDIIRIVKYAHNSLVADTWRSGRVFLAGDAAHLMPPSAGQGLCSGVRDAVNLAWKLAAVLHKNAPENLLETYEQERKAHLQAILRRTLFFSSRLKGDTAWQRITREAALHAIQMLSPLKNYLQNAYNAPPVLRAGFLGKSSAVTGKHAPQYRLPNGEGSDTLLDFRFAVVVLRGTRSAAEREALAARNIAYLEAETDFAGTPFADWLRQHALDSVLIRPDGIVFEGGKAGDWAEIGIDRTYASSSFG